MTRTAMQLIHLTSRRLPGKSVVLAVLIAAAHPSHAAPITWGAPVAVGTGVGNSTDVSTHGILVEAYNAAISSYAGGNKTVNGVTFVATTNLLLAEGLAKPTADSSSFTSVIKNFPNKRKALSLTFNQSPVWDNWIPLGYNIRNSIGTDAPVLIPVGFAEGRFYLITQFNSFYSPGPWVDGVEARAGVDLDGNGSVDTWTNWQTVKEQYNHTPDFIRVVSLTPAALDLSSLPPGYGFQFEFRVDDKVVANVSPIMDRVEMTYTPSYFEQ